MRRHVCIARDCSLILPLVFSSLSLDDIFCPADFDAAGSVVVAVSGGGDSVALALLLQAALNRLDNPPRLVAITVDHALRAGSAAEARGVGALCAAKGIAHETFVWQGEKPKTGLAQQARLARYRLLFEAAQKYKARSIFTGHTLDDQVETYLMRAMRCKGEREGAIHRGLAAMPRLSQLFSEVKLIRPLLQVRRADLRHFLQQNGVGWIEDPSNEDQNYERVRVRASLNEANQAAAIKGAQQALLRRRGYNAQAVALLSAMRPQRLGECYVFEYPTEVAKARDILPQLMSDLAALVGGAAYLRQPSLSLQTLLTKETDAPRCRLSWSGSIIERRRQHLLLWRERRNLISQILPPKTSLIWDGRYLVKNNSTAPLHIQPPHTQDMAIMAQKLMQHQDIKIPATAHLAMPVVASQQGMDIPLLQSCFEQHQGISLTRILAPYNWLVAEEDIALVHAFTSLFSFTIG